MATWQVKVINWVGGAPVAITLGGAKVRRYRRAPHQLGEGSFVMHPENADVNLLAPNLLGGRREVQFWRNGVCRWWGVPLNAQLESRAALRFDCVGLLWWITRRFYGPVLNNYWDPNADFEDPIPLNHWTPVGVTAAVSPTWRALGTQSAKLTQAAAGVDSYLRRRHTTDTTAQPVFFAAKALLHIPAAGWVGPAFQERGLYLEAHQTPGGPLIPGVAPQWASITETTPRGHHRPVRLETGITVPQGYPNAEVEGRLYAPGHTGGMYWDATAIATEESVGSTVTPEPSNIVVTRVMQYIQAVAQGKSSFHMPVTDDAAVFAALVRIYQFHQHGNVFESLLEYPRIGNLEFDVVWPPDGSSRSLHLWPGRRGVAKPASVISYPGNVVLPGGYGVRAGNVTTSSRWLGSGEGADREIGWAVDTSGMDGIILESSDTAPLESAIDSLKGLAVEDLFRKRKPSKTPEATLRAADVFDQFDLGDSPTVNYAYGYATESGPRRVTSLDVDAERDAVTVGWEEAA